MGPNRLGTFKTRNSHIPDTLRFNLTGLKSRPALGPAVTFRLPCVSQETHCTRMTSMHLKSVRYSHYLQVYAR